MKKKSLAVFGLISIIAILLAYPLAIHAYNWHCNTIRGKIPEPWRRWVDLDPFQATWCSWIPTAVYVAFGVVWMGIGIVVVYKRFKHGSWRIIPLMLMVVLLSSVAVTNVMLSPTAETNVKTFSPAASSDYYRHVDVLCVGDQVFMNRSDWIANAESVLESVNTLNFLPWGINFSIRGWQA